MDKYKTDIKAQTDIATAEIKTYFQQPETDANNSGVPDIMEIAANANKVNETLNKASIENKKLSFEMQKMLNGNKEKAKDRELERENMKNDMAIAKTNAKNRAKSKPKTKK